MRSEDSRHGVWIINESDLEAATELAERYSGTPSDASRAEANRIRKQREAAGRPVRIPGASGGRLARGGPVGQATLGLIVLSVAVSLLSEMGRNSSSPVLRALFVVPISPDGYYLPRID